MKESKVEAPFNFVSTLLDMQIRLTIFRMRCQQIHQNRMNRKLLLNVKTVRKFHVSYTFWYRIVLAQKPHPRRINTNSSNPAEGFELSRKRSWKVPLNLFPSSFEIFTVFFLKVVEFRNLSDILILDFYIILPLPSPIVAYSKTSSYWAVLTIAVKLCTLSLRRNIIMEMLQDIRPICIRLIPAVLLQHHSQ